MTIRLFFVLWDLRQCPTRIVYVYTNHMLARLIVAMDAGSILHSIW